MSLLMDALRKAERARKEVVETGVKPDAERLEDGVATDEAAYPDLEDRDTLTGPAADEEVQATPIADPVRDAAEQRLEARPGLSLAPLEEEGVLEQPLTVAALDVSVPRSSGPVPQDSAPPPTMPAPEAARPAAKAEQAAPNARQRSEPEGRASEAQVRSAAAATPVARESRKPERPIHAPATGTSPRQTPPGSPEPAASRTKANAVFLSKRAAPPARPNTTRVMVLAGVVLLLLVVGAGGYLYLMDDGGGLVPQGQVTYQPPLDDEPAPVVAATGSEVSLAEPRIAAVADTAPDPLPVTSALRLTPESAVPLNAELPARALPHETTAPEQVLAPATVVAPSAPKPMEPEVASSVAVVTEPLRVTRSVSTSKVDGLVRVAWEAYMQGSLTRAREGYQEALALDRLNRDGLLGLAAIEAAEGNPSAAAGYYRRLLERDPRDPAALDGMVALGGEAAAQDEQALRSLSGSVGKSSAALFALGNLYAAQDRWSDAQEAYYDAYSRAMDNADYAFNLAISLEHLGQRQPALNYYRQAVELARQRPHGFDRAQAQSRIEALLAQGGGDHGR